MAAFPPHDENAPFTAGPLRPGSGDWEAWGNPAAPYADHTLIPEPGHRRPDDAPFVVQGRDKLLLLVGNAQGWLLAELRFDRPTCTYIELRRSTYAWPREALTALLSRIVTGSGQDADVLGQVSEDFRAWASTQLAVAHRVDPDLCPLNGT